MATNETKIKQRVIVREPKLKDDDNLIQEYITTAIDRIKLYTGLSEFPEDFNSIAVEVVIAMYRRKYHEGISNENADVFSVTFIQNLLKEYDREFSNYFKMKDQDGDTGGKLVFR